MTDAVGFFDRFMPHGMCYAWQADILWLNVFSDALIAAAYVSIPMTLFYFLRRRPDVPFRGVIAMFSVFIFACAMSHALGVWVVWNGHYGTQGMVKALTAIVSIMTAAMLFPVMPRLMALRSPFELEQANAALKDEIRRRRETEEQSSRFFEAAPDATIIVNEHGHINLANDQAVKLFGYGVDELIGKSVERLIPERFTEQHPRLRGEYFKASKLRPMGSGRALYGRAKDGTEIPVEISLNAVGTQAEQLVSAAIRDVSERRNSEREMRELREELAHVGRISTMGELAAGLAHELNQPLTAIAQNIDVALQIGREDKRQDSELLDTLRDVEEQALRAGEIIRALRQFVRKEEKGAKPLDLDEIVRQTVKLLEGEAQSKNIRIEIVTGSNPARPIGNRVQIVQVIVNLIRNAIESIAESDVDVRKITVTTQYDNEYAGVRVEDTGPGVGVDVELFKPFTTHKEDGMGMGLAISRRIIEALGGRLWCDHEVSRGARFAFHLPLVRGA